ncbi:MAG: alpha,2-mannosyltransferase [Candidatus Binatota bacterium]|nr:alpha,2-mannosyltransferase [Candidatus Binatota bacterium]
MGDFRLYHQAATRLIAGERIYRLEDPHRYLYAPVVTFLFVPFAWLPLGAAKVAWYAVNVALTISAIRLSSSLVFAGARPPPGFGVLLFLLTARFVDNNLGHGQINLVLYWWIVLAYVLAERNRRALAGCALATAVVTKLFPIVLVGELVLRRQWRFAAATLLAIAGLVVAPYLWWGSEYADVVAHWLAALRDQVGHYDVGNKINQSISAFVHRSFGERQRAATAVVHALFLLPLAHRALQLGRDRRPEAAGPRGDALALALLYATVASPYSWKYYFVDLMLPFAAVLRRLWSERRNQAAAVLLAVLFLNLVPGTKLFGRGAALQFQIWSFHFLAVAVLFAAIYVWSGRDLAGRSTSPAKLALRPAGRTV